MHWTKNHKIDDRTAKKVCSQKCDRLPVNEVGGTWCVVRPFFISPCRIIWTKNKSRSIFLQSFNLKEKCILCLPSSVIFVSFFLRKKSVFTESQGKAERDSVLSVSSVSELLSTFSNSEREKKTCFPLTHMK